MNMKFIRLAILVLFLAIGGIIFLVIGIKQKVEFNQPRADIETVTANELKEGMFVEGEIYELWNEFAYTEEYESTLGVKHNEKTTDRFFTLPMEYSFYMDSPKFIAICSRDKSELSKMVKMQNEAADFYQDGKELVTTMHFVGKVQKLDNEYLQFFKEYIAYEMGVGINETDQYIAPYVIRSWPEDNSTTGIIIGAVMAVLGLGGAAVFIIKFVKSRSSY